jgi:RHS repeat-associated protein
MKNSRLILLVLALEILLVPISGRAQTLSEILGALQDRRELLRESTNMQNLLYPPQSGSSPVSLPSLIAWQGVAVSDTTPAETEIESLSINQQVALVRQAWGLVFQNNGEGEMFHYFGGPLSLANYPDAIRLLGSALHSPVLVPWYGAVAATELSMSGTNAPPWSDPGSMVSGSAQDDGTNSDSYAQESSEGFYLGAAAQSLPATGTDGNSYTTYLEGSGATIVTGYYTYPSPSQSGTLEVLGNSSYFINGTAKLPFPNGSSDANTNQTFYQTGTYMLSSSAVPLGNEYLELSSSLSSSTLTSGSFPGQWVNFYQDPNLNIGNYSYYLTLTAQTSGSFAWPQSVGFSSSPGGGVLGVPISCYLYFAPNLQAEFSSTASPLPEAMPPLRIVPDFAENQLKVRLANEPSDDCTLYWVLESDSTQSLAARHILNVEGCGKWDAVWSGLSKDREPEYDWNGDFFSDPNERWPDFLTYLTEWWRPVLRQLKTETYFVNIVENQGSKGATSYYEVDFYRADQVGAKSSISGTYSLIGTPSPIEKWVVRNMSQDDSQGGQMRVAATNASGIVSNYDVTGTDSQSQTGVDTQTYTISAAANGTPFLSATESEVYDPTQTYGQTPQYTYTENMAVDGQTLPELTTTYWDVEAHPAKITWQDVTINYSYSWSADSDNNEVIQYLAGISQSGGPNPYSESYDSNELMTDYQSGSTGLHWDYSSNNQVVESGSFNSQQVYQLATSYSKGLTSATTDSGMNDAASAENVLFPGTDQVYPWGPEYTRGFDGTLTTYSYAWSGTNFVTTTRTGREQTPGQNSVYAGTQTVTTVNSSGMVISSTTSDILSGGLVLDYANATTFQGSTPFPSEYLRPHGATESYGYNAEGEVTSFTDVYGVASAVTLDSQHRAVSGHHGGISFNFDYNPGYFGYSETANGRTYQYQTDYLGASGTWTASAPAAVTITRSETPDSLTTTYSNTTTSQNSTDTFNKDTLGETVSGNASEPLNISRTVSSSGGWTQTTTHQNDSSFTDKTVYDAIGRLVEHDVPDPNGSPSATVLNYGYTNGLLTSATDPLATTTYSYQPDGSLQEAYRGGRSISISRGTQNSSQIQWICTNSAGQTLWQETTSGVGGGGYSFTPYGQSGQAITLTPSFSNGKLVTTLASSLLNGTYTWQDGVGSQYNISGPQTSESGSTGLDDFDAISSSTFNPGAVSSNAISLSYTSLGFPSSLSGPISGTFTPTFSSSGLSQAFASNSHTQTENWSSTGDWLGVNGFGDFSQSWNSPSYSGTSVTSTMETTAPNSPFTKNLAGTLRTRQFPDGSSESFQYDSRGGLSSWKPAGGDSIDFAPNDFGQPTEISGFASHIGYDADGRLNQLSDLAGTLALSYTNGVLTSATYSAGPLSGQGLTHGFNGAGQLQSVALPGSKSVGYNYTSGKLSSITTAGGNSVQFSSFDPVTGRPTSYYIEKNNGSTILSVASGFDGYGRNSSQSSTAGGSTVSYSSRQYNADGDCYQVTAPEGLWSYYYSSNGFLQSAQAPGGVVFNYSFDQDGRPSSASNDFRPNTCINSGTVQVLGTVAAGASVTINGTATAVSTTGTTGTFAPTFYVPLGGWQSYDIRAVLPPGSSGDIAEVLRTAFVPPRSESIYYNTAGALQSNSEWSFNWNELGQLTTITQSNPYSRPTATEVDCTYDSLGRRVQKQVKTGDAVSKTTTTLWDNWLPVMETDRNSTGTVIAQRWYTWGPDVSGSIDGAAGIGGLLEIYEVQGGLATVSLPIYDGIGNIIGLVDGSSGARVATYSYGPFGEVVSSFGPRANQCPFRYQTRFYDSETGYYYFGKRYFDPKTQTWLSRDPIREEGGVNLYAYCNDDPVGNFDPIGLADQNTPGWNPWLDNMEADRDSNPFGAMWWGFWGAMRAIPGATVYTANATQQGVANAGTEIDQDINTGAYGPGTAVMARGLEYMGKFGTLPIQAAGHPVQTTEGLLSSPLTVPYRLGTSIYGFAANPTESGGFDIAENGLNLGLLFYVANELQNQVPALQNLKVPSLPRVPAPQLLPWALERGSVLNPFARFVPNPGGKLGDLITRQTTQSVILDAQTRGYTDILTEVLFRRGPLAVKNRFADVVATNPVTGESLIINIGEKTQGGMPVMRERQAFDDIIFSPTLQEYPNSQLIFIEKGASGLP